MFSDKMPVVGVLGTNGHLLKSGLTSDQALLYAGYNTGNLIYQYAVNEQIKNPKININIAKSIDFDFYKEIIDVLVFPAANQLNPAWDLGWLAEIIEKFDKPVIVVGLGGQATLNGIRQVNLQPGTIRLLEVLSERSVAIGFRGEDSADLASRYGATNGYITGCPSNFINMKIDGGGIQNNLNKILMNRNPEVGFLKGTLEEHSLVTEREIYRRVYEHIKSIILQTNFKLFSFINNEHNDEEFSKYISWEYSKVNPKENQGDYIQNLARKGKFYFSVTAWIDESSRCDLNIGQRIHGAIAAIQGGGLGVCVAFDARTKELVETMGYPYLEADVISKCNDVWEMMSEVVFDKELFNTKRAKLYLETKKIYEQHGVVSTL